MRYITPSVLIAAILLIAAALLTADNKNTCDMNALPCNFTVQADSDKHMHLINIAQHTVYSCDIHGLAAVEQIEHAPNLEVSITPRQGLNFGYDMTLNAQQLESAFGYVRFYVKNPSDVSYTETIACIKQ